MLGLTLTVRFGSSPEQLNVELVVRGLSCVAKAWAFSSVPPAVMPIAEHVAAELELKPASAVRGESSGRRQCDAWTLREARPFREDTGGPP